MLRASRTDITPSTHLPLFGRVGRHYTSNQINSALEANCILISSASTSRDMARTAAIVAIDCLYPSQALVDAIREKCAFMDLNLEPAALMLVASHTHNAPSLDSTKLKLGTYCQEYLEFVAEKIATCLAGIQRDEQSKVMVSHGQTRCNASVFRRRMITGFDTKLLRFTKRIFMAPNTRERIDNNLKLVIFSNDASTPIAVLWTWPCHAVSEPAAKGISADFPGAVRNHIRDRLAIPSLPTLYFPGFSGDIRPASKSLIPLHKSGSWLGIGNRFAKADRASARRLHRRLYDSFDTAYKELRQHGAAEEMTQNRRSMVLSKIRTQAQGLAPITCDEWTIGPLTIKAVSAEVSSVYSPACGGSHPLTFVTGCSGQVFGYIPTDKQLTEGGYEAESFAPAFSVPGTFNQSIEACVKQLIGR